ncbi:MAG TPA: SusD/RagB family nutrient-binding outer membrane lipoprotein, partial [Puia sp.]
MKTTVKNPGTLMMLAFVLLCASCTKNFTQINQSPDFVSTPNIDFELPYIELTMIDNTYYTMGDYVAPLVGQVTQQKTYISRITPGDETGGLHWKWIYQNPMKNVVDLMDHTKSDPTKVNYYNIGRIIKVYLAATLTDTYGDMPYAEAVKGYTDQTFQPKFDAQKDIYADLFNELQQAANALDSKQPAPTGSDIVYKGDLTKWKKFAYGMMLRLGLRIIKVDPANSAKWVNAAIAGGLPSSNADNFLVNYLPSSGTGGTSNPTPNGQAWIFINYPTKYRLTKPFVDFLVSRNDPRTPIYCMLPGNSTKYAFGDTVSSHQKGYPMFGSDPASVNTFSTENILTLGRLDAPYMHLSYAQVQFQL